MEAENIVVPKHIAIIMDGNGRWAKKRNLPRKAGHKVGSETFREIARYCEEIGVKYLTVYAFSTENWKRPEDEVKAIMTLLRSYLNEAIEKMAKENIAVRILGDLTPLSKDIKKLIDKTNEISKSLKDPIVTSLCINYGGRDEIKNAMVKIAEEVQNGNIAVGDITEELISDNLYTKEIPDPDLVIRPSGEIRLSNFLLWQSAYSEFYFTDVLWPDFTKETLDLAILTYNKRERRFGGIKSGN